MIIATIVFINKNHDVDNTIIVIFIIIMIIHIIIIMINYC